MAWSGSTAGVGSLRDLREAFASEQITFANSGVTSLTVATYNPSQNTESGAGATGINLPAQGMMISVLTPTSAINFTLYGTTPTTTTTGVGHQMSTGDNVVILGINNIRNFKAIAQTATSSLVQFTYFR